MATITVNIPNTNLPAINDANAIASLNDFPSKLTNVLSEGESINKYIDKVSKMTNVPANLIKLFMFLSSKGDRFYESKDAFLTERRKPRGLMGISDATAQNTLYKEWALDRFGLDEYTDLLKSGITSEFIDKKIQTYSTTNNKKIIGDKQVNDYVFYNTNNPVNILPLNNERVNILLGSMLIGQLLDKYQNKIEQIVPIYLNLDNPKNVDYNWAINFKGTNIMDLYNKLTSKSKSAVNLAMSKGGFLNKFV
jgi:hypothetical protein